MTDAALKELLARHGKEAMEDAEAENDAQASAASVGHAKKPTKRASEVQQK